MEVYASTQNASSRQPGALSANYHATEFTSGAKGVPMAATKTILFGGSKKARTNIAQWLGVRMNVPR